MEIPKNLKICGKDYTVQFDPTMATEEGYSALGFHRGALQLIQINPNYSQSMQDSTLLHEIIEAINYSFELGMEHKQISALEEVLYQVLKENKLHFDE